MWIEDSDEDKQQNNESDGQSVGSGGGVGAVEPDASSGSSAPATPSANKQPAFATVQDYLSANTNQGNDLGQKVTSNLQGAFDSSKNAIDTAAQGTIKDANAATVNADQGLISDASLNPTSVANDPNRLSGFLNQYNAQYSGPQSFEGSTQYADAAKAKTDADTKAAEVKSPGGQQQLIQDQFNVYGQGNKNLDQALLQNSDSSQAIQDFAPKFSSVTDYLNQQAGNVNAVTGAAKATTDATKAAAQAPFANKLTDFQNDLNSRTAAAKSDVGALSDRYQKDLKAGDKTALSTDLKEAGVPDAQIANIAEYIRSTQAETGKAPDLSQFYTFNPNVAVNPSTVATKKDYDNAAAYKTLTGTDFGGVLNPADASKAGTFDGTKGGINAQSISDYLKGNITSSDKNVLADTRPLDQAFDPHDVAAGSQYANQLFDALKRSGTAIPAMKNGFDFSKYPPRVQQLLQQAYSTMLNPPGGNIKNVPVGIKNFVDEFRSLTNKQ